MGDQYIRYVNKYTNDLYHNLALEHSILRNQKEYHIPTVRIWRTPKSIVLGRTQDIRSEVSINYCKIHDIEIGRRISGGGCVYLDRGNINISFFFPMKLLKSKLDAYDVNQISEALTKLLCDTLIQSNISDITLYRSGNILYKTEKISGSAGFLSNDWYLHHATLLVNANLKHLNSALLARDENPKNKRRSKYYKTTNLVDFNQKIWEQMLQNELSTVFDMKVKPGELSTLELHQASELKTTLYSKRSWIFNGKRN